MSRIALAALTRFVQHTCIKHAAYCCAKPFQFFHNIKALRIGEIDDCMILAPGINYERLKSLLSHFGSKKSGHELPNAVMTLVSIEIQAQFNGKLSVCVVLISTGGETN
jgi:hypothetical protein